MPNSSVCSVSYTLHLTPNANSVELHIHVFWRLNDKNPSISQELIERQAQKVGLTHTKRTTQDDGVVVDTFSCVPSKDNYNNLEGWLTRFLAGYITLQPTLSLTNDNSLVFSGLSFVRT